MEPPPDSKPKDAPESWQVVILDGETCILPQRYIRPEYAMIAKVCSFRTPGRQATVARLLAASPKLADALVSIEEYWNRDQNDTAMADALWHIIETARAALALLEEKPCPNKA